MRKPIKHIKTNRSIATVAMTLLLCVCICLSAAAQSAEQLFTTANNAYKDKNYTLAVTAYQKLVGEGYRTAEVYYNLGNACYKTDQLSLAILNYEKALKLSPSDEDIRFNLKLANMKTIDRINPVPQFFIITRWQNFVAARSSRTWAIFSVVSVWLALIAFAVYLFVGDMKRTGFYSGAVLLVFAFFFFFLSYIQHQYEYGATQAILTSPNAYVKSAPDGASVNLFLIHDGVKLNILDRVGTWSKVSLADGKVGWVEQGAYSVI